MRVFVTGGAGYIGSHTLIELLKQNHEACVYDNYSNSSPEALSRVRQLTNKDFVEVEGDIRYEDDMIRVMKDFRPDAVIHFAGLKAVGESNDLPLKYYEHNVQGSVALLKAMDEIGCRRIVFSSSATVYGEAEYLPYDENHRLAPTNPYGRTKYFVEEVIRDWSAANPDTSSVLLRYFNPVGAHESGRIGEDPNDIPNNLMPYISQVAVGKLERLQVFGDDYDTRDGTGERDYIHVVDLARAHLAALDYAADHTGCEAVNVGTGNGATVLEMVAAFAKASGREVPYIIGPRRAGDIGTSVAATDKASKLLKWQAEFTVEDMCRSGWKWQSENPNGYKD